MVREGKRVCPVVKSSEQRLTPVGCCSCPAWRTFSCPLDQTDEKPVRWRIIQFQKFSKTNYIMLKWTLKYNANQSITWRFTPLSLTLSSKPFFLTPFVTVPLALGLLSLSLLFLIFPSCPFPSPFCQRELALVFPSSSPSKNITALSRCHSNLYFSLLLVPLRECMCYSGLFMEGNIKMVTIITFHFKGGEINALHVMCLNVFNEQWGPLDPKYQIKKLT